MQDKDNGGVGGGRGNTTTARRRWGCIEDGDGNESGSGCGGVAMSNIYQCQMTEDPHISR